MKLLTDANRDYQRYRPSPKEKTQLANKGLQYVLSSNVSAVGTDGDDLIIRFHNSSIYKYPNRGHLIDDLLRSNSKGKWVFRHLRRTQAQYSKIGSLPLKNDVELTDTEIFGNIDSVQADIEKLVGKSDAIKQSLTTGVLLGQPLKLYNNPGMDRALISVITTLFIP